MSMFPIIIVLLVAFVAFVFALQFFVGRNLTTATAQLQALNAEYNRRQEELRLRVKEAERQYNELMAKARAEAEQILARARQEAESTKSRTVEEARAESDRIIHMAMSSRDALRKEIEQEMERRTIERACEMIRQSLPLGFRQQIQTLWIEELFHNGLAQLDRSRFLGNGNRRLRMEPEHAPSRVTNRDRPVEFHRVLQHRLQLIKILGGQKGQPRNRRQIGDVKNTVMRDAVVADQPGPVHRENNRQILDADVMNHLVVPAL